LPGLAFHTVIFDEVQELRRAGTEKYSAASLLSESCQRVMGLSGTPIYNYGGEIWNVINILDYHFLGDWESFSREWCAGYGNRIVLKPQLLGDHLRREGLMLRRTKQEVLPELPEKRRLVQEIDADDALYARLMAPVWEKLYRWRRDQALSPSARALLEDQISQEARQATGLAKAPYVCQFVKALLAAGEKVLLFAHHHAVMDIYKKELKQESPAFITGRETAARKEAAAEQFMLGKTDLCVVSLRAASGLNLQRATCVVFGELDWSPAVHAQAEDRAHRMGQRDSLLCYYLVSPRGSDQDMQEALGLKVSQFQLLMGDQAETAAHAQAGANYARQHVENLVAALENPIS
jgi:SNF2 family DNA or RNA helicase